MSKFFCLCLVLFFTGLIHVAGLETETICRHTKPSEKPISETICSKLQAFRIPVTHVDGLSIETGYDTLSLHTGLLGVLTSARVVYRFSIRKNPGTERTWIVHTSISTCESFIGGSWNSLSPEETPEIKSRFWDIQNHLFPVIVHE